MGPGWGALCAHLWLPSLDLHMNNFCCDRRGGVVEKAVCGADLCVSPSHAASQHISFSAQPPFSQLREQSHEAGSQAFVRIV